MRTLSHEQARRTYNRIGAKQDTQAFYEDVATRKVIEQADFPAATSVFEFGCGTGRFAETLLRHHLGPEARYKMMDLSPTMVGLAEARLSDFGERVQVVLSDGGPPVSEPAQSFDRFVSNYVFDLLSESDIRGVVSEAHRMLRPGGLLCLASLAPGRSALSHLVMGAWSLLYRLNPALVGGCRPIRLMPLLETEGWRVRHHEALAPLAIPSEVIVAERR